MDLYLELSRRLAEKQMIEKIIFELEYNFLFLKKKKLRIYIIEDVNVFTWDEYLKLFDLAIKYMKEKNILYLIREGDFILMG